jgi:metal-responsive CopG/Arc/MetJ family transcriptional regulator
MEAIKQIVKIPSNHEITIKVPHHIAENELMEVILLVKNKKQNFTDKIMELKKAMNDPLYQQDMKETMNDFTHTDLEGWE